jgi:transposase InsO family protein
MPWKERCAVDLRIEMINDWLSKEYTVTELSHYYQVSRKTLHKWIKRYRVYGEIGLKELSRVPHYHPNTTSEDKIEAILRVKKQHLKWGPRKVIARLRNEKPGENWPADSTVSTILRKHGLINQRKYRHHTPPYTKPFLACDQSNRVWSADYKGQFRMGNERLCYPLTISDNYSRYVLVCQGLTKPTYMQTQPYFEWAFRQYGLPDSIRTDNGTPFASAGLGGLSRLSVWFIKLGIRPERITAGCPEQNGRHERMHKTLKDETADPPKKNINEQQKAFNDFVNIYNNERPHEALGQRPPASVYCKSSRGYPYKLPSIEYDNHTTVRYVHPNGRMTWHATDVYISQSLSGEYIGLKQTGDTIWEISFGNYPLGLMDERKFRVISY